DRLAVLEGGRIVQVGRAEELRERPATEFVRLMVEAAAGGFPSTL
nr:ABC transporter ATP-binding protein [Gemmatimonadales bacterium]